MPPVREISSTSGMEKYRLSHHLPGGPCAVVATLAGLLLLVVYVSSFNYLQGSSGHEKPPNLRLPIELKCPTLWPVTCNTTTPSYATTDLSHIVFGIVGSLNTLKFRKPYVESWWWPNVTRGYLFLDGAPDPNDASLACPLTCPPVRVNEDITHWDIYPKITHPIQIRMVRSILETFRQDDQDVRWFLMADDDSVLLVDNIVEVLSKYDHTKYVYLGGGSESIGNNAAISFDMGFGGAGLALSYPLVSAMAKTLDGCIKRYPATWSADFLTFMCISDLGVAVDRQKGFHQIDLRGNLAGFLSSHPQSPLLSLHHIDAFDPIFPSMNRPDAINHLMEAAKIDQSRVVQQNICYQKELSWSISISWGYSAHIYENKYPRYILRRPIETFNSWSGGNFPLYMFNTRPDNRDPCEAPHWFFFKSIGTQNRDEVITTYERAWDRGLAPCSAGGNHSADHVKRIQVISSANRRLEAGSIDCCDVLPMEDNTTRVIKLRSCLEAEEIV